jgi:hypothetical protein
VQREQGDAVAARVEHDSLTGQRLGPSVASALVHGLTGTRPAPTTIERLMSLERWIKRLAG